MPTESSIVPHLLMLLLLGLVPFLVIATTCFAKTAVVLAILKNALGGQGVPPLSVITSLALIISLFIMAPVAKDTAQKIEQASADTYPSTKTDWTHLKKTAETVSGPLKAFLERNTPDDERRFYGNLAERQQDPNALTVTMMAFASIELKEALLMGVALFIPFIVVDLLVSGTLGALGLVNVPVTTIAIPLKLLLFVTADGFHLLVKALMLSYG